MKHITLGGRTKYIGAVTGLLLASLFAAIAPSTPAQAAGEQYVWKNSGSITMSRGIIPSSYDLTADGTMATGMPELHRDADTFCPARLTLSIASDNKTAQISGAGVASIASAPGSKPVASCSDAEVSAIEALRGTTVQISGTRSEGAETALQREIGVYIQNNKKKSDSPKSLVVTLKDSKGKTVKSFTTNIGDNGNYYGTFKNIDAGAYTVCVDKLLTNKCQGVTKEKYKRATVSLGEYSTQKTITVKVEANVAPSDPAQDETFGPFKIELRKGTETIKSKNIEVTYASDGCKALQDRGESCTGSVTASEQFDFNDVESGDYTVCLGERCVDAKKKEGVPLSVTLSVNQDDINNNPTSTDEDSTTCAIDGVGWIVCPIMTFMAGLVDSAYNQIAAWLLVTPLTTTTTGGGSEGTMYSAWSTMRNIANIAFVIAFMVIIYSQLTSVGLSNYGIKKMLPKIMVAAILVNVSYWICAVAIDVSNIAGQSLYSLFDTDVYTRGIKTDEFDGEISSSGNGWTGLVAAILASAGLYLALPALIVALPAALFAIVTVFLVLALRQVLIILLVVISPLAFVALLLPNTEDWFKKWKALLQTLLLLYPIIAVIFGASAMASTIVMNSAKDIEGDGKLPIQIMGALITILPLAITPIIMKFGGGVLNRFGGMINNPNKGPFDALRKRAEATAGRIRNNRDIRAVNGMRNGGRLVPQSMSMRRRGLDSASKRDQIQRQRDSAVKSLAYQGTTQNYTKRANDQDKITQRLENDFEVRDIQGQLDGAGLHADVRADLLNSQFSRKVAESTEKDRAEEAHIMNNRNGYQQMYAAGENLEAQKTESHNEFGRTEMGELTAQRVKSAGGEKKIIEGEHELAFQGSNVGMAQAGQMKAVDGQLDIVRGEQEIEFEGSGVGVAQAITKDNVAQRKSAVTARSETAAVQQNADVRIQAQAAKDTLDVAKADETAFVQELRTEKGAAEHLISQQSPEVQAVVQELQQADTQRRVETQRATNAQTVATYEYATAVGTDTANPSQLAVDAGGIAGRAGVSQAQAVARQTMLKAANEAISAEKSTMSTMKARSATPGEESHMSIVSDPNASPERRAAAAGMIMQNGSMEDIHELSDVVQRMGNTDEARDIRMQMVSDMNRTPFGWGAGDIAALKRGEAAINPDTGAPKDYNEMMDMRAKAKLSDSKWANLDPDDLRKYSDLATNGQLTGESLQNLVDATYDAETNDNISLTTEAKKHGEAIRAYAATIGINPTP